MSGRLEPLGPPRPVWVTHDGGGGGGSGSGRVGSPLGTKRNATQRNESVRYNAPSVHHHGGAIGGMRHLVSLWSRIRCRRGPSASHGTGPSRGGGFGRAPASKSVPVHRTAYSSFRDDGPAGDQWWQLAVRSPTKPTAIGPPAPARRVGNAHRGHGGPWWRPHATRTTGRRPQHQHPRIVTRVSYSTCSCGHGIASYVTIDNPPRQRRRGGAGGGRWCFAWRAWLAAHLLPP